MPEYPETSYSIDDEVIDIVSTRDTLGGAPRLDGHRTAVYHILAFYRTEHSIEDIAGDAVYPHLSESQVRAALHYAVDYPEAVERSSKPRDTPLIMDVSYNTREGGPTLSVFDHNADEPGAIAETTLSIDELPDGYDDQDLHSAWHWMHYSGDRPAQSDDRDAPEHRENLSERDEKDVNERVETEWVDETPPFERIQTVVKRMYEPHHVQDIADRAQTGEETARKHLRHLAEEGFIDETASPRQSNVLYRRSPESLIIEQTRDICDGVTSDTLVERVSEMQSDIQSYRKGFGVESPEDADIDGETLHDWQTTRRNLAFARVALALNEAEDTIEEDTEYE